jgi:hypothetical protein
MATEASGISNGDGGNGDDESGAALKAVLDQLWILERRKDDAVTRIKRLWPDCLRGSEAALKDVDVERLKESEAIHEIGKLRRAHPEVTDDMIFQDGIRRALASYNPNARFYDPWAWRDREDDDE